MTTKRRASFLMAHSLTLVISLQSPVSSLQSPVSSLQSPVTGHRPRVQSRSVNGLMMDFPLTLSAVFRHAEQVYPRREVVTRRADKSLHRYTLGDFAARARRLAGALRKLGVAPGDRVATLAWNHHQHLEAYFGVSMSGAVLHTLNLRLHPDELSFIVNDADDAVVLVDETLLPLWEKIAPQTRVRHAVVVGTAGDVQGGLNYETLLAGA